MSPRSCSARRPPARPFPPRPAVSWCRSANPIFPYSFRYGINAIDTSPYYTTSETVIGKALEAIRDEFPRSSYQILTKAGRYGRTREDGFDYSAARVRRSVGRSCELLKTTYLDAVYMHDVEFVAELVGDAEKGGYTLGEDGELRQEDLARWGLLPGDEGKVRGPGDEKVLEALGTLFELKKEGVIRAVGFSGTSLCPGPPLLPSLADLHSFYRIPLADIAPSGSAQRCKSSAFGYSAVLLPLHCALRATPSFATRPLPVADDACSL